MSIDVSRVDNVSVKNTHKADVQVGRDVFTVEYFVSEHSVLRDSKKMNCFEKVWDAITTLYHKIKWKIKDAYWEVRYGFQRMFKGYDVVDTFETYSKFIDRYTKILKEYRKEHVGHIGTMTNEEWEAVIDEMLYHLKYMDEWTVIQELEKDIPDDWNASLKTVNEVMDKHKNEFFRLFSEYFYNLWD